MIMNGNLEYVNKIKDYLEQDILSEYIAGIIFSKYWTTERKSSNSVYIKINKFDDSSIEVFNLNKEVILTVDDYEVINKKTSDVYLENDRELLMLCETLKHIEEVDFIIEMEG